MVPLEKRLVAAALKDRKAYEQIVRYADTSTLTTYSTTLFDICGQFYKTDPTRNSVDIEYVIDRLELLLESDKKRVDYGSFARECFGLDISTSNVVELIHEKKRKESAERLAQALINTGGKDPALINSLNEFRDLLESTSLGEVESDIEILHEVSVEEINKEVLSKEGQIPLLSAEFTKALDGGPIRGDTVLVIARPEIGKTAAVISIMRSLCRQKKKTIYFGNEDAIKRIVERFQSCLSGMSREERLKDPKAANDVLRAQGYGYVKFVQISPGSVAQIDKITEQEEPVCIVIDQMRNLNTKAENRTNQLETIATDLRSLAKRRNVLLISVTQAGDSATNKLILDIGDIDSSNTGIPAQQDLIVGLGCDDNFYQQGLRMISFSKNKISGKHTHLQMKINPALSRLEDI